MIIVVLICQMEEDKERVEYALAQMEDLAHSSVHAINQFIEVSTDDRSVSILPKRPFNYYRLYFHYHQLGKCFPSDSP